MSVFVYGMLTGVAIVGGMLLAVWGWHGPRARHIVVFVIGSALLVGGIDARIHHAISEAKKVKP